MEKDLQTPFDVAVIMATVVRPTIADALRSVYAQQFAGRIQILIGIDRWEGERSLLAGLLAECPTHIAVTTVDLGYSTSLRHGGLYPSSYGGALKTVLTYAANSRYVAYLDDDNAWLPTHLATMRMAIEGKDWAFALRSFVDGASGALLCADTWESLGPGRGVYAKAQGGFVDTNCYLIDKLACPDIFLEWANTRFQGSPDPAAAARATVGDERRAHGPLPVPARRPARIPAVEVQMRRRGSATVSAGERHSSRIRVAAMRGVRPRPGSDRRRRRGGAMTPGITEGG
jgi:hypothetical protein